MKITCLGAARTVTGSSYLIEMDGGDCFLVDCGMYQGGKMVEQRNYYDSRYRIDRLKAIFVTHAHIDHSGLVPRLVRQGYKGPVYATDATCDLLEILWLDAAHIQEMEAEWQSRKNKRRGNKVVEALYETPDAEKASKLLRRLDLDADHSPLEGVTARFVTAGHILGAASLHLRLQGDEGEIKVGFSGDIGRPGQLIVPDPEQLPDLDMVFMETTYGSRLHKSLVDSQQELIDVVNEAYKERGKVIIPAFAVERTQEIIYTLAKAWRGKRIPKDIPIFLDSPLAIKATDIFRQNPEFFDEDTREILEQGDTPINLPTLKTTPRTEESQKINDVDGPAIIIAGSGMANAGRIKHHLKHNLWKPNCHVVIVGFQAQGTTGRLLVEGARRIKLFREDVVVAAKIHTIGGFSAHADQSELLEWLKPLVHPGLVVNLIHGEESAIVKFKSIAESTYPEAVFNIPNYLDNIILKPKAPEFVGAEIPEPEVLEARSDVLIERLSKFQDRLVSGDFDLSPEMMDILEAALEKLDKAAA